MNTTPQTQCAGGSKPPSGLDPKRLGQLPEEPDNATLHNAGIRHRLELASSRLADPKVDEAMLLAAETIFDMEFQDPAFLSPSLRSRLVLTLATFASCEVREVLDYIQMGAALNSVTSAVDAFANQN